MLRFAGTGVSHVGLVRENNEDSGFVGQSCLLVADGVGGGPAGELASATTASVVSDWALRNGAEEPGEVLTAAVSHAEAQLAGALTGRPDYEGMATTLTAVAGDGDRFALIQVGDSRAYVFRDGRLTQVSRDQTWVQLMVDQGRLTPDQAAHHPWSSLVLRAVDGTSAGEPVVTDLGLVEGDRLLLCSDGLSDLVGAPWLQGILADHSDDGEAATALVAAALTCGGRDNVTCVVASVVQGAPALGDGSLVGAVADPANVLGIAATRSDVTA